MVQGIGTAEPNPATGYQGPYEVHILQVGETLESLAERFAAGDPAALEAFRALNPALAGGRAQPGTVVLVPLMRRAPTAGSLTQAERTAPSTPSVETSWTVGFGRRIEGQNDYNTAIRSALARWPQLDPLILKSILAQESGFRPTASNSYGYAGIAQMGLDEAHLTGLKTGYSRKPNRRLGRPARFDTQADERFVPRLAIPAAASLLRSKTRVLDSGISKRSVTLHGFDFYGRPEGDDFWRFAAAAYNAGEGTVLYALRRAYGDSPPVEVRWEDLVESPDGLKSRSPLWRALRDAGLNPAVKYREVTEYANNVVRRARQ